MSGIKYTFNSSGTLVIPSGVTSLDYLIVAGGGGSGGGTYDQTYGVYAGGSGGGAGGMLEGTINNPVAGSYSILVGNGGVRGKCGSSVSKSTNAGNGGNSSFSGLTAIGGGAGMNHGQFHPNYYWCCLGFAGGSGGGAAHNGCCSPGQNSVGGVGTAGQGNNGGTAGSYDGKSGAAAGGGGKGGIGGNISGNNGGAGGAGKSNSISGAAVTYAAGGRGGNKGSLQNPVAGTANTGNGAGGGNSASCVPTGDGGLECTGYGAAGGKGIVIVRLYSILPLITTTAITNITTTGATGGGNVTYSGNSAVTSRGICWNTTGNPTTADTKTINGSGVGSYVSYLTGLTSSTDYYVRAYAINSGGVSYGNQVFFTTETIPPLSGGTIASGQTICYNANPAAFTSVADASGGTTGYTYQWQYNTGGTWTDILGANATTYDSGTLTATRWFRRRVIDSGSPALTGYTNTLEVTVYPLLYAGSIEDNQIIISGQIPMELTTISNASGASDSYIYQWQNSLNGIAYSNIAGATGTTYQPPVLTATTYYKRRVYDTFCGIGGADYSNVLEITVVPPPELPTGLTVSNIDCTTCRLDWTPAETCDSQKIEIYNGGVWEVLVSGMTPLTTYSEDIPLNPNTDNILHVCNVYGGGDYCSDSVTATTVQCFLPPPFCEGSHWTASGSTCGNSNGSITIIEDNPPYLYYFDTYDFTLTDVSGNSYTFITGGTPITGLTATGLTSNFYTLTATPKPAYWYYYGNDTCTFDWIPLEDSDTSISLLSTKLKHAICQGFGKQTGRITLELTDSGTTTGWTYTLWTDEHVLVDEQTFTGDTFTGVTNITTYVGAGKYYAIVENDSGCKYLSDLIKIQSEQLYTVTGIRRLFITPWSATTSYNYYSSSDEDWYVTGIDTLQYTSTKIKEYVDLADFWYEIKLDTAVMSYGETFQKDQNGLTYAETVTISIPKAENSKWKQLVNILTGRYIVVFQDNHENWWTCFYRWGAEVKSYSLNENQYVITFRHPSVNKMLTSIDYSYIKNSIL